MSKKQKKNTRKLTDKNTHAHEHNHGEHEHEHSHGEHCGCEYKHHHDEHSEHSHEHSHGEHCGCDYKHHHDEHSEHFHEHSHGEHCGCEHKHHHDEHSEHSHEHSYGEHCGCEHKHDHHEDRHDTEKKASHEKRFTLEGLDCPHCASQIENELEKSDGIAYARINLINEQLTIGVEKSYKGDLTELVTAAVKLYEPEVNVIGGGYKSERSGDDSLMKKIKSEKNSMIRFCIGTALFAAGFLLSLTKNCPQYVYLPLLVCAYIVLGCDVVVGALRNIMSGRVFDEQFLMTVSTLGAFAIGEYPEAVAVMLFYQIGEFFQSLAVKRSRRSISELMDMRPDSANLIINGSIENTPPENVSVGDTILVKPGEKIPLDGIITKGETMLDTRALTGESVPRRAKTGDEVLSGCVNGSGAVELKVTKAFGESTASKILDLVENAAGSKAPTENFISVFARYYTPVVVVIALLLAVVPPLVLHGGWAVWVRRCFVFLVVSCPCALVISIPLTYFGGIGAASRQGVLVKGSNYLEALAFADTVVFDKTGTLTKGLFKVTRLLPSKNVSEKELLKLAAAAESMSDHPIARCIKEEFSGDISSLNVSEYKEFPGHGVSVLADGKLILAGSRRMLGERGIGCTDEDLPETTVYVSADGEYIGCIVISDEVKPDSKTAAEQLKKQGVVRTIMLTGDTEETARRTAADIGIDEYHSSMLPVQKVEFVDKLINSRTGKGKLVFVGDGINDAPVLARADVGAAMGALGSDAAIEAADIVLMNDSPSSMNKAIDTARYTRRIVMQNIVLVLSVKAVILILGALGLAGMWEAVFGDVGVMILAVLNSLRIQRSALDT